jgi:hypothetical protein
MPRYPREVTRQTVVLVGGVMALVAFAVGFLLTYNDNALQVATGPTTTAPKPALSTPRATPPPTTSPRVVTTTMTTVPTTATTGPQTVPTTGFSTTPSTRPSTTVVSAPAHFKVTYPHNPSGEMKLLEGSTSAVIILNDGGSSGTYLVQGVGFITVGANGTSSGTLAPGAVVRVPLVAGTNVPLGTPPPQGSVTVFDGRGPIVTIPIVITSRPGHH